MNTREPKEINFTYTNIKKMQRTNENEQIPGDPSIWGPKYWFVMKCAAKTYPLKNASVEVRTSTKQFYESLKYLLPCKECRDHYLVLLEKYPVNNYLHSRQALINWVKLIQQEVDDHIVKNAKTANNAKNAKNANNATREKSAKESTSPAVPRKPVKTRQRVPKSVPKQQTSRVFVRGRNYVALKQRIPQGRCKNCGGNSK